MNITDFNPGSGPPGTYVTLNVSGMPQDASMRNTSVLLNGLSVEDVTAVNVQANGDGTISVTIDDGNTSGTFQVIIISNAGSVNATSADSFDVIVAANPVIQNMIPRQATPGQQIRLAGQNLDQIWSIIVQGQGYNNTIMTFVHDATSLMFRLPMNIPDGVYRVYAVTQARNRLSCPTSLTVNPGN